MKTLVALTLVFILWSCSDVATSNDASVIDPNFFNLQDFVAEQETRLAGTAITKSVTVNEIIESKEIEKVDWELELAPFVQSNIDRPAMWDAYSVDTSTTCGGRITHTYQTLDSSNFTKLIRVVWLDTAAPFDSVYALTIENSFNSYIADTRQRLVWWNGGYTISSIQDAILSDVRELDISGVWDGVAEEPCQ